MSGEVSQGEVWSAANFITLQGLRESAARMFPKDTVLVAMYGATAGQVGILRFESTTNQAVCGILPSKHFVPEFLFYLMLSRKSELAAKAAGNAQPNISQIKIKDTAVPVPPLSEQQRIVRILDEAFDSIATAKANAEKNLKNARALWEKALCEAIAGKLTEQWRSRAVLTETGRNRLDRIRAGGKPGLGRNHKNSPEIPPNVPLGAVIPEEWAWASLDSLCSLFVDSPHRTPVYSDVGIPALRPRDISEGRLMIGGTARVSEEEYRIQTQRYVPQGGDVVYSRELSYGWAATLEEGTQVCLSQGMCVFRPVKEVGARFCVYALNGPFGREQANRAASGAAHPHINLGDIKSYAIPLPPLGEQEEVDRVLDGMAAQTQKLESIYRTKLSTLDELKKSLLHQAFAGNL